jgi:DNA-directed DNA polymerase III PolC
MELAVSPDITAKEPSIAYVTLYPTISLRPVNELYNLATKQFRYVPLLSYGDLASLDSSVIIMPGRGVKLDLLPEREYVFPFSPSTLRQELRFAIEKGYDIIPCSDNRYPSPEDREAYAVLAGRISNIQTWDQHILRDDELRAMGATNQLFENRDRLAERILSKLPRSHTFSPPGAKPIEQWCREGAVKKNVNLEDPVYKERLERELGVIVKKGYEGYFQIIAEMTEFARKRMLVGPARGSAAGSLVCYLMDITTVNPIEYGLVFERFLDVGRTDLPDIDLDFAHEDRHLVFEFFEDRYGVDRVCRLGAAAFYRAKSVAKEVCMAVGAPGWKVEPLVAETDTVANKTKISATLHNSETGRRLLKEFPGLLLMDKLDGHPTHATKHASGIVITEEPVAEYLAVDHREGNRAMIERTDAERQNILKIDVLGLKQLSMYQYALELIGKPRNWLNEIPLDDKEAFKVLNDGRWSGIFQWEGQALQRVTRQFTVDRFDDLAAITSLARPGPLGSGGTDKWIRVRRGDEKINIPHPAFAPIVENTCGIVIYQEQLMQAGLLIGDMDWATVTKLRKVCQYFTGKHEMEVFRIPFIAGALNKGIDEALANRFWDDMLSFASYAFNKSHAVSYALISYWGCYLKAHYPVEFAAGIMSYQEATEKNNKQLEMLRELREEGIDYVPVGPDSGNRWKVTMEGNQKKLLGPITNIKGVGKKMADAYQLSMELGKPDEKVAKKIRDSSTIVDSLYPIEDAIKRNYPDLRAINIVNAPTPLGQLAAVDVERRQGDRGVLVFGLLVKGKARQDEKWGGTKLTAHIKDDTGNCRIFISNKKYDAIGRKMLEAGKVGDTIWAIKGTLAEGGDMIFVDLVRSLGTLSGEQINKSTQEAAE